MTNSSYATATARLKTRIQRSRHYSDYGVHTSRITPLNPPLIKGGNEISGSLPFTRGGLGWGKTCLLQLFSNLCVHRS
jgi:hypothetical protein